MKVVELLQQVRGDLQVLLHQQPGLSLGMNVTQIARTHIGVGQGLQRVHEELMETRLTAGSRQASILPGWPPLSK